MRSMLTWLLLLFVLALCGCAENNAVNTSEPMTYLVTLVDPPCSPFTVTFTRDNPPDTLRIRLQVFCDGEPAVGLPWRTPEIETSLDGYVLTPIIQTDAGGYVDLVLSDLDWGNSTGDHYVQVPLYFEAEYWEAEVDTVEVYYVLEQ